MEEDYCSETPNININSGGEPAEVPFITALIKKIWLPIPITSCIFIHNFPSTSTSCNLSQQQNHTSARHQNDPTGPALTLLGDGGEYIRGRGSNPDNNHDFHDDDDPVLLKCVICLYDVAEGEKYRVLGHCKHGFHVDCIGAWLDNNSTCPLCRSPVPYTCSSIKDQHPLQALRHAILSCFLVFLDHLCNWFLNPLGFDDPTARLDPRYVI